MTPRSAHGSPARRAAAGFTLVELMIALVLGLLVIAGAVGIFMSNRREYASTETLGRMQETARVAFELMARDVREAGGNPCAKNIPIANTLNATGAWYTDLTSGLHGYDDGGSGSTAKLAASYGSTDAIDVMSGTTDDVQVVSFVPSSAELNVNKTTNIQEGDLALVCDYKQGAIFQVTQVQNSPGKIQHNPGYNVPGNCTKAFDYPVDCSKTTNPKSKAFTNGATVAHFTGARWYVGSSSNGPALYRSSVRNNSGTVSDVAEQVAEGVSDMQLTYLQDGGTAYVKAQNVTNWSDVIAVRITLTIQSAAGTERGKYIQGTDNNALTREITHTVMLRNRLS